MLSEAAIFVKFNCPERTWSWLFISRNQSPTVLFMCNLGVKWRIAAVVNFYWKEVATVEEFVVNR